MRKTLFLLLIAALTILISTGFKTYPVQQKKIKVLIITGGHGFEHAPFYSVFDAIQNISYDSILQPQGNVLINSPEVDRYDLLIFYDLADSLSSMQQQAYINLLNKGKAMIFLHHSIVSYQKWPEFIRILGGQYHTSPVVVNHDTLRANYQHDVNIPVVVADKKHPITNGLNDFEVVDEIYGGVEILPTVKPLLTTSKPGSMNTVAWINHYGNSDIVYIQLGHGPSAFNDPNYRRLIRQAIDWSVAHHTRMN